MVKKRCVKSMFESMVVPANMLAGNNELLNKWKSGMNEKATLEWYAS